MSNTDAFDPSQRNDTPPDGQPPEDSSGPTPGGVPSNPDPTPSHDPASASVPIEKPEGMFSFVGAFLGQLHEDWQKERELRREIKRAKALGNQRQQPSPQASEAKGEGENATSQSPDLLQEERNKRIRMISEFTDVKETLDHRIKRVVAGIACMVVPWLLVVFLTSDVGEYFAGQPFTTSDWTVAGIFGLTALLETVIAVVTNAWGNTVHDLNATDIAADKSKLNARAKTQFIAWSVLSLVSGFALFMFLMQQSADNTALASGLLTHAQLAQGLHATVSYTLNASMTNVVLRVLGTLAIDPACVFAVHTTTLNLDQFLKQQNQVTTAITQISDAFDKQQEAAARADMRRKENERFLELKSGMDTVNASMMQKMGDKLLQMSDTMFEHMQLPQGKIVDADQDDDDGRNVRRLRR